MVEFLKFELTKEQSDDLLRYGTFAVYGFNEITEIEYTEFDYGSDSKLPNKFIKIYHISYSGKGVYRSIVLKMNLNIC